MDKVSKRGIVQVYTGDGKGKTTAAIGQAVRACGWGWKVSMVQFMKGIDSGEVISSFKLPDFNIYSFGSGRFLRKGKPVDPMDISLANRAIEKSKELVVSGDIDLLILDEVNCAVDFDLVKVESVIKLIDISPPWIDMILTGRNAHRLILEKADLVTEMRCVKHHGHKLQARRGIEF